MENIDETLVTIFETAAGKAFKALLEERGEEHFYYFALLNDGNWRPYISAWSYEALNRFCDENEVEGEEREQKNFEAYETDKTMADAQWKTLLNSMEEAMRRLDQKGIFGTGGERDKAVIAVEIVPPVRSNYSRTERLNKNGLIREFLEENKDLLEEETDA